MLFTLLIVLLVLLVLALGGHTRYGIVSWSPAGVVLIVLLVLWLTGNLHR